MIEAGRSCHAGAVLDFRRILWVKSVSLDAGVLNYGGEDPSVRHREPRAPGDAFELHATPDDADSLAEPEVGDWIVLTQEGYATHLVEVVGETVRPRRRRSMRPNTRDARFSVERTVELVVLRGYDRAARIEAAFGFDPRALGGAVLRLDELDEVMERGEPLWMLQRRIALAFEPRHEPRARPRIREERIEALEPGPGRVRRHPEASKR